MARKKLGEMLLEAGVIDQTGLRAALVEQRRWGGHLGRVLIDMKMLTEETLVGILSKQLGIGTVDLDKTPIPQAVLDLVPGELAEQFSMIPFAQPMKFLDVAMSDPTNLGIVDELRIRTQLNIRPYLAGPKMIERALAKFYGRGFGYVHRPDVAVPMHTGDVVGSGASRPAAIPSSERRAQRGTTPQAPAMDVYHDDASGPITLPPTRDAEIDALQVRISSLEALVARDEQVLRKLLALLVEKGLATRDEILERLK
jgi:type IV pilus assembly protein PilB